MGAGLEGQAEPSEQSHIEKKLLKFPKQCVGCCTKVQENII